MKLAGKMYVIHRWVGLFFAVVGVIWFGSAAVIYLYPYRDVPPAQTRLAAHGEPLQPDELRDVVVRDAAPDGSPVRRASLYRFGDQLVWRLDASSPSAYVIDSDAIIAGAELPPDPVVDAVTGSPRGPLTAEEARRVASRVHGGDAAAARVELITDANIFYYARPRPAYRVSYPPWPTTDVYIDPSTASVTALIGTKQRMSRLFGTMPHYFQFWPLTWSIAFRDTMRTVGLIGFLVAAVAGIWFALWRLGKNWKTRRSERARGRSSRRPALTMANVHNWLGIGVFAVALFWASSGFIMYLWYHTGEPTPEEHARTEGASLRANQVVVPPAEALAVAVRAQNSGVRILNLRNLLDRPIYEAIHEDGKSSLVDAGTGSPISPLAESTIQEIALSFVGNGASVAAIERLDRYDPYYYSSRGDAPLPVYRVDFDVAASIPSPVYINPATGVVVRRVDGSYRTFRWIGRGLHTFDFPALLERTSLRHLAVLIPSLVGLIVSATGLWLGMRHVYTLWRRRVERGDLAAGADRARETAATM